MSQAVDDRWWMEWAREMLKYYPDWSATERGFLENMCVAGWISEKQAHWLKSLCERYAIVSFVQAVESEDFGHADLNLAWLFNLYGLPVSLRSWSAGVELWMARPRRVCKGMTKDGRKCNAEVAKEKDYCPPHRNQAALWKADA